MSNHNHAEALRRLGNLLASVERCVLDKFDATRDAGGNDTYVPTPGLKAAFDAQFTAVFNQVKNRENLTVAQFHQTVERNITPALEAWIEGDGLSCQTNVVLEEIRGGFERPPIGIGGDGSGVINP
jgi:hypothetical protein